MINKICFHKKTHMGWWPVTGLTLFLLTIIFLPSNKVFAQERRFGLDEPSAKNSQDTSPRRYFPTENNRRFGLKPGESEPEITTSSVETSKKIVQKPTSLIKTAQHLLEQGQLEKALATYQKALIAKEPSDLAHLGIGYTLIKLNKFDEAIKLLRANESLLINNSKAQLNLGVAFFANSQTDEAINCYKKAIEINKGIFPDAKFNLAMALFHQGKWNEAVENYKSAIEQRKIYPTAYNNLGLVYQAIGNNDEAVKSFQRAIEQKQGHYPLGHYNLARSYFLQGKFFPEAVTELETAIEQQKNFPEAFLILGNIYLIYENSGSVGAIEKAKTFYEKAIDLRDNYPLAHENLAITYSKLGKKQEAFEQYRKALNLYSDSSLLLENLLEAIKEGDSFSIKDEFSVAETTIKTNVKNLQQHENKGAIKSILNEYNQLPEQLKANIDARYCFGKAYTIVFDWNNAINELNQAVKLSNNSDREAKELLSAVLEVF